MKQKIMVTSSTTYTVPSKRLLEEEVVYYSRALARFKWWQSKSSFQWSLKRAVDALNEHYPD